MTEQFLLEFVDMIVMIIVPKLFGFLKQHPGKSRLVAWSVGLLVGWSPGLWFGKLA